MSRPIDAHTRTFLELLQVAVGNRTTLSCFPATEGEWVALVKEAERQGLLGVFFSAIQTLLPEADIPMVVYFSLEKAARKIRDRNREQLEAIRSLAAFFRERGYRTCLLKGQAAGAYYPDPLLRQSGDIDIWVEGERKAVISMLARQYSFRKILYIHADVRMMQNICVEVHFTPSWMNAWRSNRRLQRWFAAVAGEQFSHEDDKLGCPVPTTHFNGVYMVDHIYRHLLEEGVGLRQILDYYYVLRQLDDTGRERVRQDLKQLRLLRFAGSLMYVLQEVFLLDSTYLLCPPDPKGGAFLLESALISGNFGRADARNAHSKDESLPAHVRRKLRRSLRLLRRYPSEVLGMPFFMLWQYLWRRRNGYLYHGR